MAPDPDTQPTRPDKGEPVEIPIPTRDAVLRNLEKAAQPKPSPEPAGESESD